ncbi:cytochrome P450 CYP82D47-like [Benincasa hispida]|uniref:cytochrome P450 CYP82D47-like n=1 Tax=Benincasa hispida TaxID=102211 RepID=UPI001901DD5A|nr:cytochrome P450 CYP82D47-like [Benincasa hispida]
MFALSHYGSYWRKMRKIATFELLSNRRMELLRQAKESEVNQAVKELYQSWKEIRKDSQDQDLVEMKQWLGELTLNVILRVVVGKRNFGVGAMVGEEDEEKARQWQKATREFLHYLGFFVFGDVVQYLGWLDIGGHVKAMKRTSKVLDRMLTQWLEEHKKDGAFGNPEKDKDFIDAMLSILKDPTHVDVLSHGFHHDTIIKSTCLTMILGGGETIGVAVTWVLSLLLNNPPKLKKVQEELDTRVDNGARARWGRVPRPRPCGGNSHPYPPPSRPFEGGDGGGIPH